ncbi:MAG: hypothetical protein HY555_01610 [Euryarchaeota archaeon]|nr:hypothetical protein [Euryarchaeota archaeon]
MGPNEGILCIAHSKDVDGIGCHAIAHRYATLKGIPIEHRFVGYMALCETFQEAAGGSWGEVIVADLGYNAGLEGCLDALRVLGDKTKVRWFDHHDWSGKGAVLQLPIEFHLRPEVCASEALAGALLPGDGVAEKVAAMARHHDFREEDAGAWRLYEVISSGYDKLRLVEALAEGVFWSEELEDCYRGYQRVKEEGYRYLEARTRLYKVGPYTCLLGFSRDELSSTLAASRLLEGGTDLVLCLWASGKVSLRRNNPSIDLRALAELFGGGGREEAAGGYLGHRVAEERYLEAFGEAAERLAKGLK